MHMHTTCLYYYRKGLSVSLNILAKLIDHDHILSKNENYAYAQFMLDKAFCDCKLWVL